MLRNILPSFLPYDVPPQVTWRFCDYSYFWYGYSAKRSILPPKSALFGRKLACLR